MAAILCLPSPDRPSHNSTDFGPLTHDPLNDWAKLYFTDLCSRVGKACRDFAAFAESSKNFLNLALIESLEVGEPTMIIALFKLMTHLAKMY